MKALFTLAALGCVTLASAEQYRPYGQQSYQQYSYDQQSNQSGRTYQSGANRDNKDQTIQKKVRDLLTPGFFSKGYPSVNFEVLDGVVTLKGTIDTQSNKRNLEESVRDIDGVKRVNNQIVVGKNGQAGQNYQQSNDRNYNDQKNTLYNEQQNGRNYNDRQNDRHYNDQRNNLYNEQQNGRSYNDQSYNANVKSNSYNSYDQRDNSRSYQTNGAAVADETIHKQIQDLLAPGYFSKGYPTVIFEVERGVVTLKGSIDTQENKSSLEESISGIDGVKRIDNQIKIVKEVRRSY